MNTFIEYLNKDAEFSEKFTSLLDDEDIYRAYNYAMSTPWGVSRSDIVEVFKLSNFSDDDSHTFFYYIRDVYYDSNKEDDYILFPDMTAVIEFSYHQHVASGVYRIKQEDVNAVKVDTNYRFEKYVSDVPSKISVFDEDNLIEAVRGLLNYQWRNETSDMYDGPVNRDDYVIKLIKINVNKNKKTKHWYAVVTYRIAALKPDVPVYVNKETGQQSHTYTVELPMNRTLTAKTLITINTTRNPDMLYDWVKESTFKRTKDEKDQEEYVKLVYSKLEKILSSELFNYEVDCFLASYSSSLYIRSVNEIGTGFLDENIKEFHIVPTETLDDNITRFKTWINSDVKNKLIPAIENRLRKNKNKEDRNNYINSTIQEVISEVNNILTDIRYHYLHDTTVKFVSDKLRTSVTYELEGANGEVPFDKRTFETSQVVKDIMNQIKPENKRTPGRSPLTLHLNEKNSIK